MACILETCIPYVILAFATLNVIFIGGKRRSLGIFIAELHVDFNNTISLTELNWIEDIYAALSYILTTLFTAIIIQCNRNYRLFQILGTLFVTVACIGNALVPNPHFMFLTQTLINGIGSALILSNVGLIVLEHFDKHHRYHILATTLVSGGSVAAILFIQFFAVIVENCGWRVSFLITAGISVIINGCSTYVFERKSDYNKINSGDFNGKFKMKVCCSGTVRRNASLLFLWTIDRIIACIVSYGLIYNLTDYMRQVNPTMTESATLLTLFAGGDTASFIIAAIITGVTKSFLKNRLKYVLTASTFLVALFLMLWEALVDNDTANEAFSFLCGFFMSPSISFLFPAGEELTGLPGHLAYPFALAGMGLGMFLSPIFTGLIAQAFQYKWFFLVQGCMVFVKFICLVIATILIDCCRLGEIEYHDLDMDVEDVGYEDSENSLDKRRS